MWNEDSAGQGGGGSPGLKGGTSALGVAKIRPPSPRRGWLKGAKPSEGLVKEEKILRRQLGEF